MRRARAKARRRPGEDHAEDVFAGGAHGEADANLAGALADEVGHDAEDADGGEKKRDKGIEGEGCGDIEHAGEVLVEELGVGLEAVEWEGGVEGGEGFSGGGGEGLGVA